MHTVTSFRASDVKRDQLTGIIADYLEVDRVRVFRRLLVKRFALLAIILGAASALWLHPLAFWFSVGMCVVAPTWAWAVELRYEGRLAHRLSGVPTQTVDLAEVSQGGPARMS